MNVGPGDDQAAARAAGDSVVSGPEAIEVVVPRRSLASLRGAVRINVRDSVVAHARAVIKRREWRPVVIRPGLRGAALVVVMVVKNELLRLPFLLDYYRGLGAEHVIVIDNESSDGSIDYLRSQVDVSVVLATGAYGGSRYGVDWLNGVLRTYCIGKWILWVDADELLTFATSPGADLLTLTQTLQAEGTPSLQAVMIDMYSDRQVGRNALRAGQDPLDVCPLFDAYGYRQTFSQHNHTAWIKGGVRGRLFFEDVATSPALNKTPLVRWRRHHAFLKSAHQLWPRRLNGGTRLGGALLHFKFTDVATAKMTDADTRSQHTQEYDAYAAVGGASMVGPPTARYESPDQLRRLGLIDPYV